MKFQVLMSTMNRCQKDIPNVIKSNNIYTDTLIINQCGRNNIFHIDVDGYTISVIETDEKGLSKSRNKALALSDADICLVADDDMLYESDLKETIVQSFQENQDYDVIAFFIDRTTSFAKKKIGKKKKIGFLSSLGLMSVQIAYRRSRVMEKNIMFNEHFGAGSGCYSSGEENIFLSECIRKGLKILYVPKKIGSTIENESSWFFGFDALFFKSKGALFQKLFPHLAYLVIFAFALLKYTLYHKEMSFGKAVKYMLEGKKECKKEVYNQKV